MSRLESAANSLHVLEEALMMEKVEFADEIHKARDQGWTWARISEVTDMSVGRLRRIASMIG